MGQEQNFPPAGSFDPAAWVAEYESLGGRVGIMLRQTEAGAIEEWFGLTYPRDEVGRGYEMELALGNPARWSVVAAYVSRRDASKLLAMRKEMARRT